MNPDYIASVHPQFMFFFEIAPRIAHIYVIGIV